MFTRMLGGIRFVDGSFDLLWIDRSDENFINSAKDFVGMNLDRITMCNDQYVLKDMFNNSDELFPLSGYTLVFYEDCNDFIIIPNDIVEKIVMVNWHDNTGTSHKNVLLGMLK